MPALRKPTAILEADGGLKGHPGRHHDRKTEPNTGRGVGPAPERLTEDQRAVWDEIVSDCAPGVFQSSDKNALEALTCLLTEFRQDPTAFGGRKYTLMISFLSRFGMTPADRSKVAVAPIGTTEKPKTGLASFRR